jgi:acyl carrier protein
MEQETCNSKSKSERLEEHILRFINEELPLLDPRQKTWPKVQATTPLFVEGILDSLSILHLIAAVEDATGGAIPDQLVVMNNFHSVRAMTAAFGAPAKRL